jgi:hypothetical protein
VDTPLPAGGVIPATRSKTLFATPSAALMLLAVNCGKASLIPNKHTSIAARTSSATLRYVTVFHAMWTLGLRVCEDTRTKTLFKPFEYAVIQTLPQAQRHQEQVIKRERYLRLAVWPA